ncbi:hypothetical protein RFI_24936, partial [Reticulomyxa filosa]
NNNYFHEYFHKEEVHVYVEYIEILKVEKVKMLNLEKKNLSKEEEIKVIIKSVWIYDFDKLIINYAQYLFLLIKLFVFGILKILNENNIIYSIEFSSFNGGKYLCSELYNKIINLWDIETYKSLYIYKGYENIVKCVDIILMVIR